MLVVVLGMSSHPKQIKLPWTLSAHVYRSRTAKVNCETFAFYHNGKKLAVSY